MSFDLFVQSCISLKRMTDVFKGYDDDRDGYITLSFEEFLTGQFSQPQESVRRDGARRGVDVEANMCVYRGLEAEVMSFACCVGKRRATVAAAATLRMWRAMGWSGYRGSWSWSLRPGMRNGSMTDLADSWRQGQDVKRHCDDGPSIGAAVVDIRPVSAGCLCTAVDGKTSLQAR